MATAVEEKTVTGLENPMGTDGFEFVEYTAPDPQLLRDLFTKWAFPQSRSTSASTSPCTVRTTSISSSTPSRKLRRGICQRARAERLRDGLPGQGREGGARAGAEARRHPCEKRCRPWRVGYSGDRGIGGSLLFFVDRYGGASGQGGSIYEVDFDFFDDHEQVEAAHASHLTYIDHLTHNVNRGRMAVWADFYERLFNFREIRYFDIEGKQTGLFSKAMTSPCGKIRIPLNESQDDKSQIEEFLREYKGEGIQHIALGSDDIYSAVDVLRERGVQFQDTPDTYYEMLPERIQGHDESIPELKKRRILMDGAPTEGQGLLLQIFTQNVIGPIFFEIIQRKGNEGFGEGNFKALFESIELDQMRRGVL
jgi:4-hydroxyphenylpyruvate dioxygenase